MNGYGRINFWGHSPPFELQKYIPDESPHRILLLSNGDPRHILHLLAHYLKKGGNPIQIVILEADTMLYARLLVILGMMMSSGYGIRERCSAIVDVWGNLMIRRPSFDMLADISTQLARKITDPECFTNIFSFISTDLLKYKERDHLESILQNYTRLIPTSSSDNPLWDERLRDFYKARYDYVREEADWSWFMRLESRVEKRVEERKREREKTERMKEERTQDKLTSIVTGCWGKEHRDWRCGGQSFELGDHSVFNNTLVTFKSKNEITYEGSVISGPFPGLCMTSQRKEASVTQNNRYINTGATVAQWNIEDLLSEIYPKENTIEGETTREETFSSLEVKLLSPEKFTNITTLSDKIDQVNLAVVSTAAAHHLKDITKIMDEDGIILVETVDMYPDLKDDQIKEYSNKIIESAKSAGWILKEEASPLFHLQFIKMKP